MVPDVRSCCAELAAGFCVVELAEGTCQRMSGMLCREDGRVLAGATALQCHAQKRARCIAGICSSVKSSSAVYMSKSFRRGQRGLWRCNSGERPALCRDVKQLWSLACTICCYDVYI